MTKTIYDEFLEAIELGSALIDIESKRAINRGSRENPYLTLVSKSCYKEVKKYLDKEDMYNRPWGWTKIVICD